jgi:hypothetical protein
MISIADYLQETEFASKKILEAIWNDIEKAEKLRTQIHEQSKQVQSEYNRAVAMQQYAEDPDDLMAGVGRYWDNYFGPDKENYRNNIKLENLTNRLAAREVSLNTLSGNLLEHAKKGLSLIYGKPTNWPSGRLVGSQPLSIVILESRNQSTHIDEAISNGGFSKAAIANCFGFLAKEIDPTFSDFLKRDMSLDVLKALDWTSYENYSLDMKTIVWSTR